MNNTERKKIHLRKSRRIETEIIEDNRVMSAYGYCELPSHFFDRALAQLDQTKGSGISMTRWGMKGSRASNS